VQIRNSKSVSGIPRKDEDVMELFIRVQSTSLLPGSIELFFGLKIVEDAHVLDRKEVSRRVFALRGKRSKNSLTVSLPHEHAKRRKKHTLSTPFTFSECYSSLFLQLLRILLLGRRTMVPSPYFATYRDRTRIFFSDWSLAVRIWSFIPSPLFSTFPRSHPLLSFLIALVPTSR